MNSIALRRQTIINKIVNTLREANEQGKEIDEKKMALLIASEYGCTERKAREYLSIGIIRASETPNST